MSDQVTQKGWLTTTEAAPLMGFHASTVWRLANSGAIPAHALLRSGRAVKIARWYAEGKPPVQS